jgi:plastocyanin
VVALVSGVIGLTLFFGGTLIALAGGPAAEGAAVSAKGVNVQITAKNVQYDHTNITVPANAPITIAFANQDANIQHNVRVFSGSSASAPVLFDGQVITGPSTASYDVGPLQPGTYYFDCKIHPTTMTGTITVDASATSVSYPAAPPSTGPSASASAMPSMSMSPAASATVAPSATGTPPPKGKAVTLKITAPSGAAGTGFAETKLTAPANTPIQIAFDNQDSGVPHNVRLFQGTDASGTQIMSGDIVTGPGQATYDVPPLAPGTYFYDCIVHPTTMTGTLTVK